MLREELAEPRGALEILRRERPRRGGRRRGSGGSLAHRRREVCELDRVLRERARRRQHLLELADVAGPGIAEQRACSIGGERDRSIGDPREQRRDQEAQIFAALGEVRNHECEAREAGE